ncbi:MAG: response regulator [Planctomycetota bacterium]
MRRRPHQANARLLPQGRFIVQRFSLTEMVEEMVNLLQVSIPKNVVLKFLLDRQIPSIEADVTQIRQVTMNLILNAAESIETRSGIVTLATGHCEVDDDYLKQTYIDDRLEPGAYAYLEVSDTGCGMDEHARKRLFEPFFTTKTTGRGLGLAAVLGIVRGHRGAIKCYSEPGRGTTFKVLFPVAQGEPQPLRTNVKHADDYQGGGLVLIVDDEKAVRELASRVLVKGGFEVLLATNGQEAVDVFRERQHEIILVLLDMMMPRLSGEETFRQLRQINPNVRVILSSGYNEQETTNRFAGKGLAGFVQKPYRSQELLEKIRLVLQTGTT